MGTLPSSLLTRDVKALSGSQDRSTGYTKYLCLPEGTFPIIEVEVLTLPPDVLFALGTRSLCTICSLRSWVLTPDPASLFTPLGSRKPVF